jgi:hypothetical protein
MSMQAHYDVPGREKQPIELLRLGLNDAEFGRVLYTERSEVHAKIQK